MKSLRLRHWFRNGRLLLTPLDHGVTMGPIPGLADLSSTVSDLISSEHINALVMHKGTLAAMRPLLAKAPEVAAVMHLNASVSFGPNEVRKVLVSSVEDALRMGAEGASVHINLGGPQDDEMLSELGRIGSDCQRWGLPLLAMMYVRGGSPPRDMASAQANAARAAWELGADVIKISYSGDPEGFARIVNGVDIPVIAAGGPLSETPEQFLRSVRAVLDAGAAGLAVGRNVFQRPDRVRFIQALARLVHDDDSVAEVLADLEG